MRPLLRMEPPSRSRSGRNQCLPPSARCPSSPPSITLDKRKPVSWLFTCTYMHTHWYWTHSVPCSLMLPSCVHLQENGTNVRQKVFIESSQHLYIYLWSKINTWYCIWDTKEVTEHTVPQEKIEVWGQQDVIHKLGGNFKQQAATNSQSIYLWV